MNYDLLCMSTFSLSITKCALCEDNIRCQLEKELRYRKKKEIEEQKRRITKGEQDGVIREY